MVQEIFDFRIGYNRESFFGWIEWTGKTLVYIFDWQLMIYMKSNNN